jgi:hypothetical protein
MNEVIQGDASCNGTGDSRISNGVDTPSEVCLKEWSLPTSASENYPEEDTGNPISKQNGDASPFEIATEGETSDTKSKDQSVEETPMSSSHEKTVVNGDAEGSKDYRHLNGGENPVDPSCKKPFDRPEISFIQDDLDSHLEDVDQLDGGADQVRKKLFEIAFLVVS